MISIYRILIVLILPAALIQGCKNSAKQGNNNGETPIVTHEKTGEESINYQFNKDKPYPYETGIIEYKYTGDVEGTQIIYFKDFGRVLSVEEEYTNTKTPTPVKTKQLFINTPDKYIFINLLNKTGYQTQRNDTTEKQQNNLLSDITTMGIDSTMRKNGYKRSGVVEISGKKCQVYTSESGESEFCFWEGMNIRTEMTLGPNVKYKLEAVNIKENADVPEDKFTPPADVKIMDYEKFIKAQTKDKL